MDALIDHDCRSDRPFTDNLTGLFNDDFFKTILELEIKRSDRYGTPFTLAYIDIDSFQIYNDRYGQIKAEQTLKQIAAAISRNFRESDYSARVATDLFSVIMINTEATMARMTLERIRQTIFEKFDGNPTISIGVASFPKDGATREGLIRKAWDSLSIAKKMGKNRVHLVKEPGEAERIYQAKILIVDDDRINLKLLEGILASLKYGILKATNGPDALNLIKKDAVDLVLLDVMMPDMDGYEVCRRIKGNSTTRLIPVVMVTALDDRESKVKAIEAGADDFITKPPQKEELLARTKSLIKVKKLNNNLASIENILFSLANAIEAKDMNTLGHVERVSNLAVTIGRRMQLTEREIEALKLGGALHDVGKIGVPLDILNKPEKLEPNEWEIMKTHIDTGYKICQPLEKNLGPALEVICYHHEKLDGSGYPYGLMGEDIPIVARIMAVVDIYDALITNRPYRKAMSKEEALEIIYRETAENKLDKDVVQCLAELIYE